MAIDLTEWQKTKPRVHSFFLLCWFTQPNYNNFTLLTCKKRSSDNWFHSPTNWKCWIYIPYGVCIGLPWKICVRDGGTLIVVITPISSVFYLFHSRRGTKIHANVFLDWHTTCSVWMPTTFSLVRTDESIHTSYAETVGGGWEIWPSVSYSFLYPHLNQSSKQM